MHPSFDLQLEIDYEHEHEHEPVHDHVGWIDCALTWDGVRHPLLASDVFPPFPLVLNLARAILTQRLPQEFFWDEEGYGVDFEALPVAPDSPTFRLRVTHEFGKQVWIDAEVDRLQTVRALFEPLQDFVRHAGPPSRYPWGVTPADIALFTDLLTNPMALRTDIHTAQWVRFAFGSCEPTNQGNQWLRLNLWENYPICSWVVADSDPFWSSWITFLREITTGQLPTECKLLDHLWIRGWDFDPEETAPEWGEVRLLPYHLFRAEPVAHPGHFRLRLTETCDWRQDYLLLDEVLDTRAFVGAFCTVLETFLARSYAVYPDATGEVFDLRTLPWAELRALG